MVQLLPHKSRRAGIHDAKLAISLSTFSWACRWIASKAVWYRSINLIVNARQMEQDLRLPGVLVTK